MKYSWILWIYIMPSWSVRSSTPFYCSWYPCNTISYIRNVFLSSIYLTVNGNIITFHSLKDHSQYIYIYILKYCSFFASFLSTGMGTAVSVMFKDKYDTEERNSLHQQYDTCLNTTLSFSKYHTHFCTWEQWTLHTDTLLWSDYCIRKSYIIKRFFFWDFSWDLFGRPW